MVSEDAASKRRTSDEVGREVELVHHLAELVGWSMSADKSAAISLIECALRCTRAVAADRWYQAFDPRYQR